MDDSVRQFERARQQGLGRPILTAESGPLRVVIVGSRAFRGAWKTFADFLTDYLKMTLGADWGNAELAKPSDARHPLLNWYQHYCWLQAKHKPAESGKIFSSPLNGAASAYLRLAYDLYTLEHNSAQASDPNLRTRLLERLKHPDQFVGARYEIRVAAAFLRAGFRLSWEDESNRQRRHGEFLVTNPRTERTFWVECKIRQPSSHTPPGRKLGKFLGLVRDALEKDTTLPRIVFVDLNAPADTRKDWQYWAVGQLRLLEGDPACANIPSAYVFVTNHPDHHHLDEPISDYGGVVEGFKMPDFRLGQSLTLLEAIAERERHAEIEALVSSMKEHSQLPSTFDGSPPEFREIGRQLVIGNRLVADDGSTGVIEEGCVMEQDRSAMVFLQLDDGRRGVYKRKLTDDEFAAWQRYPETFFGVLRGRQGVVEDPIEFYTRLLDVYSKTSREKLLELMADWPNRERLRILNQEELAKAYCAALAVQIVGPAPSPPELARLRPVPERAVKN